jgi:hypothetical protein
MQVAPTQWETERTFSSLCEPNLAKRRRGASLKDGAAAEGDSAAKSVSVPAL